VIKPWPGLGWLAGYAVAKVADIVQDMKARGRISALGWKVWTIRLTGLAFQCAVLVCELCSGIFIHTFDLEMLVVHVSNSNWLVEIPLSRLVPLQQLIYARHTGCVLLLVLGMVVSQSVVELPQGNCPRQTIRVLVVALATYPEFALGVRALLGGLECSPSP
jgi:hypothetical protein